MCGIAGFARVDGTRAGDDVLLARMCDAIFHRGPDEDGMLVEGGVALGMRRLSIIDVAGGHQPISTESGDVTVVFNGATRNTAYSGRRARWIPQPAQARHSRYRQRASRKCAARRPGST
jgi:asparagine synthetase B (glutamine-hydrolysing)